MTRPSMLARTLRRATGVRHRGWLGRLLRAPLRLIPGRAVVRVLTGPNRGLKWVKGAYINGCWLGTYEADKVDAFVARLGPEVCFWDVGANVGYFALVAARRCPGGSVVAFEPVPRNLAFLHRHVALNQLDIRVIEAAVGTEDGVMRFDTATTAGSGRLVGEGHEALGETLEVQVRGAASLLAEGLAPPDVVKMDIEGAEATVLPALLAALPADPVVFLAVHDLPARRACTKTLTARGYTVTPLDGRPIEQSDEWLCLPAA